MEETVAIVIIAVGILAYGIGTLINFIAERQHRLEERFRAESQGIEGVRTAIEDLDYGWDPSLPRAAIKSLRIILPSLPIEELESLDRKHIDRLYGALRDPQSTETYIAILGAVEKIGDSGALYAVQSLGHHESRRVREAAWKCEASLRERIERSRERTSLLRATFIGTDSLVRPAQNTIEDEESLLRHSEGP